MKKVQATNTDNTVESVKCPICGKMFTQNEGALSREDNKTKICSECGIEEAMSEYMEENKMINTHR